MAALSLLNLHKQSRGSTAEVKATALKPHGLAMTHQRLGASSDISANVASAS